VKECAYVSGQLARQTPSSAPVSSLNRFLQVLFHSFTHLLQKAVFSLAVWRAESLVVCREVKTNEINTPEWNMQHETRAHSWLQWRKRSLLLFIGKNGHCSFLINSNCQSALLMLKRLAIIDTTTNNCHW